MPDLIETDLHAAAASEGAGDDMHIHKPKAAHSLREFLSEISVIVVGIAIALAGEQTIEALTWRHKTDEAEKVLRQELSVDLSYAAEQQALGVCANRYIDMLQKAVAANRPDVITALYRMGPPTHPHPWRIDTWTAALNAQVPDHMRPDRVQAYSLAARFVNSEEGAQWELFDLYSQVMAGRFGHLADAAVAGSDLAAVDRLRANEARRADITEAFLRLSRETLGVLPSTERAEEFRKVVRDCEAKLKTVPTV